MMPIHRGGRALRRVGLMAGVAVLLLAGGCAGKSDERVQQQPSASTPASGGGFTGGGTSGGGASGGGASGGSGTASGAPGGSSGNGGATSTFTKEFAACMRANGVPAFPDPTGQAGQLGPASGIDPGSATFKAALNGPCRSLAPTAWLDDSDSGPGTVAGAGGGA